MLRITRFLKGNIKNNRMKHYVNYTNTVKNGEKKETIKDPVNVGLKDGQKEVKEICVSTESELSHNEKQELNDITNSKPNVSETGKNKLSDNCVTKLNIDQNEKKKVQNDIEANIKDKQHNVYHKQSKFDMHIKRKLKNLSHQKAEISPNLGGLKYFQKLVETKKYNENLKNVVEDLDVNSLNDDDRSDQGVFKDITRNDFNKSVSDTNVHDLYEDTSLKSNMHKNKTEREMTSLPLDKETNLRASVEFVESEQLSHVSEELRSMSFIEELGSKSSVEEITTEPLTSRSTDEDIKLESLSNISDGEVKAMLFKDFASASSDIDIALDSQASSSFKDVELETLSSNNPDKKLASLPAVNNFGSSSSIEGVKPEGENDIQMEGEEDVESLYMYAGKYVRSEMKDKDLCNNLGDHLSKLSDNEENLSAREEVLSIIRNKEKVENHNVGESVYETEFVKKDIMPVSSFMPSSLNNTETLSKVVDGEKDFCPVEDGNEYLLQKPIKTIDGPLPKSYSLATYVEKSELLTNLVKLGVDLSKVERNRDTANFLVRLDYKRDVEPCLFFLRDIGIPDDDFGKVLTKNPFLCRERIEDLQTRVNYFASKKFLRDEIASIITRRPTIISMQVKLVDAKLGFYQKQFKLKGPEVRLVVKLFPKVLELDITKFKGIYAHFIEFLGFTDFEMRRIFLTYPRLFSRSKYHLVKRFDYMHNIMGLSHKTLTDFPSVFGTRLFILQQRHKYLVSLGRAQYDPTVENYISPLKLCVGGDDEFCENVAKTTHEDFKEFLKTL